MLTRLLVGPSYALAAFLACAQRRGKDPPTPDVTPVLVREGLEGVRIAPGAPIGLRWVSGGP